MGYAFGFGYGFRKRQRRHRHHLPLAHTLRHWHNGGDSLDRRRSGRLRRLHQQHHQRNHQCRSHRLCRIIQTIQGEHLRSGLGSGRADATQTFQVRLHRTERRTHRSHRRRCGRYRQETCRIRSRRHHSPNRPLYGAIRSPHQVHPRHQSQSRRSVSLHHFHHHRPRSDIACRFRRALLLDHR